MSVGEMLGYATSLIDDLGLTAYIVALAIVGVAVTLLNRIMDR